MLHRDWQEIREIFTYIEEIRAKTKNENHANYDVFLTIFARPAVRAPFGYKTQARNEI
jgi:hypothetical protein